MSEGRSWRGDWVNRLYERTRERGYNSVTEFADARPAVSLLEWSSQESVETQSTWFLG